MNPWELTAALLLAGVCLVTAVVVLGALSFLSPEISTKELTARPDDRDSKEKAA